MRKVFSYLSAAELGMVCRVNREWNRVASDNVFWTRFCFSAISWENLMEIEVNFKLMRRCQMTVFRDEDVREGTRGKKRFLFLVLTSQTTGCGTYDWKNGNVYCGQWKGGQRHGWGHMNYHNKDS
jgi:hypothetical protein